MSCVFGCYCDGRDRVFRIVKNVWMKRCMDYEVEGVKRRGGPRTVWKENWKRFEKSVFNSVIVLEESPCYRGPIYKSLSLTFSQSPWKFSRTLHSANSRYVWFYVTSINSVTATVHEDTVKNLLLMSGITYWYMSASKPFFTIVVLEKNPWPCPRGPIYKSLSLDLKSLS